MPPTGLTTKGQVSPKDVMQIPTGAAPEQRVKVSGKQPIQLNKDPDMTRNLGHPAAKFDARNKDLSDIQYHTTNLEETPQDEQQLEKPQVPMLNLKKKITRTAHQDQFFPTGVDVVEHEEYEYDTSDAAQMFQQGQLTAAQIRELL